MIRTKMGWVPGIRIATIAEPRCIPLKSYLMPSMITFLKAFQAHDTSSILFAVFAAPPHIAWNDLFRANSRFWTEAI